MANANASIPLPAGPAPPRNGAPNQIWSRLGRWNYLTEDQRKAWRDYGKKVRSHPQGGQSGPLTGQMLYTAINRNQAALGLPPFDYPPERPEFGPNPVAGFRITVRRGRLVLKLTVSKAPAAHILVFASAPSTRAGNTATSSATSVRSRPRSGARVTSRRCT